MSKTSKHQVLFNGIRIGIIFISRNPNNEKEKVATIVPIDTTGSWSNDEGVTVTLQDPVHGFYPHDIKEDEINKKILAAAAIEPWKVSVSPTS